MSKPSPRRKAANSARERQDRPVVVALCASAGGVETFETLVGQLPTDAGLAYVVVAHLDSSHPSALPELLARRTSMSVARASDGMEVGAGQVYVIPPDATLSISGNRLQLVTPRASPRTIDPFLHSLAEDQENRAIAVILSGAGSDGTDGLAAVKEHGGLVIAQAPGSARFGAMPRSAIETGLVDYVLPLDEIPTRLLDYARHLTRLSGGDTEENIRAEAERHLPKIFTLLRTRLGHDFGHYKDSTVLRRLRRRMQVTQSDSVAAYVDLLRREPAEIEALFRDLLIGVTHFFRDPRVFEALEREVIPKLLEEKPQDDPIRVWVAGCASGEEAYSIAILLREAMRARDAMRKVQIFATDIDDRALAVARAAIYPESISEDVSPERLEHWFIHDGSTYRVVKEVRDMCIFSVHDLVSNPPFSRLDLISCRNLMIYFDATLQARVLSLFHFALGQRGYLVIGPSENVTPQARLFTRIDAKHRIFRARAIEAARPAPEFPLGSPALAGAAVGSRRTSAPSRESLTRRALRIVDTYAPASLVVDENYEVLHFSGRTGRFLQPAPGLASLNLFSIVDPTLRHDLRTVLQQAFAGGRKTVHENLAVPVNGSSILVNVVAEPLPPLENEPRLCVLVFQELGPPRAREAATSAEPDAHKDAIIVQLENELVSTRERLQATIEELETSNEEMKSSNEEFQSVTEELQSSNEELETSKEELQSINEELETVNAELSAKVESLDRANNDRRNLLESTQIATVFLDAELRIKSFTPSFTEIFHLIDSDVGRPITDMTTRLDYGELGRDVQRVLRTLERIEREVRLADGSATYIMRILPYRTFDNVIDGVVVTFVDITERKRAEEHQSMLLAELNHRVKNMLTTVMSIAARTLRATNSLEEFRDAFEGRLAALARAHELLARHAWGRVALADVARAALDPYALREGSLRIEGVPMSLAARSAPLFAMVFHELGVNAIKHGALSSPEGRVDLSWAVEAGPHARELVIDWVEKAGPAPRAGAADGFGLAFIQRAIEHELKGSTEVALAPEGLRARLRAPLDSLGAGTSTTPVR